MKLSRRQWITMAGGALVGGKICAASENLTNIDQTETHSGNAFGSGWVLTTSGNENSSLAALCVGQAVKEVNQSMSPYLLTSELSMFNRLSSTAWYDVSAHFGLVLNTAMQVANQSNNAFDPTLGSLVNQYGFGPISGASVTGVHYLEVRENRVRKLHPGITLDLCGIAKGYALDLAASYLRHQGINDFLLEIGGELLADGRHPAGRDWRVAIENPLAENTAVHSLLPLDNQAIATSGTRQNAYTVGERRYSHLMDGKTKQPISHPVASVTVLADTAMLADAWSTALMVAGDDSGLAIARDNAISALFLGAGDDAVSNRLAESRSGNFPSHTG